MTATDRPATLPAYATHEVTNQPPPLLGRDLLADDAALTDAVRRHVGDDTDRADDGLEPLHELGRLAGSVEAARWGEEANRYPPVLRTHDRYGHRVDEIDFHPAWHSLMTVALEHGLHAVAWTDPQPHAHVRRAAGFVLLSQVEAGHGCPVSMTYAAVPALQADPALASQWVPVLASTTYDPSSRPVREKAGGIAGMGMTEKQGGSDVRANSTTAVPVGGDGEYLLTGHKWFCSAPMSDLLLVLAQAPGGLTCFALPRVLDDGTRNPVRIERLKDKLGNRSNASGEIELQGAWARRLGDEGRGVATILEMVAATRLDCVLGSTALVRRAVSEAAWHVAHRRAFGTLLADAPLMQAVLADLAVEYEAAVVLGLRLAAAVDARDDPHEHALRRIALPLAKYWVCKRTPTLVAEALECLGGNGYVEDSGLPRLFRESPLNSIWEGSGNVNALDVLRALRREPAALEAWLAEVGAARGGNRHLDAATGEVLARLADLGEGGAAAERGARLLAERMALVLQGALLVRHAPDEVADAFCLGRLSPDASLGLGALPGVVDVAALAARATPPL